jgi:hypothetical protein
MNANKIGFIGGVINKNGSIMNIDHDKECIVNAV